MKKGNIYLKKKLGQYFLKDKKTLTKIIDTLELTKEDTVLEIGAGSGVLTLPIADKVKKVIAVEIDPRLCGFLEIPSGDCEKPEDNIIIIKKDFLKVDLEEFAPTVKIVSNLPYYITTPIITKVCGKFDFMVFTMQEEVARRLISRPGGKEYGSVSVFVQFYYDVEIVDFVQRRCFAPVPNVDSCIVRFKKKEIPRLKVTHDFLFKVVRKGFSSRRKMLRNTLSAFGPLDNINLDLKRRPETLSVNEFCKLAEELLQCKELKEQKE